MELKHIKELMSAMGRTGMKHLTIKKKDFELELEREVEETFQVVEPPQICLESRDGKLSSRADAAFTKGKNASFPSSQVKTSVEEKVEEEPVKGAFVKSPMVGTFYSAPSPDDPPFVKVGDKIDPSTVVGIVEAMKVMNEIKAGMCGTVDEIMIEDGHPVEFGSLLYKIVD